MKHFLFFFAIMSTFIFSGCQTNKQSQVMVSDQTIGICLDSLSQQNAILDMNRAERGIRQAAALWRAEDGNEQEFQAFVLDNYANSPEERRILLQSISTMLMNLYQYNDLINMAVRKPTTLTNAGEPTNVDVIMSGFDASSHLTDDLYSNKVAFICILNFPHYSLSEKNEAGGNWSREEWAEARLGDVFTERIPADIQQIIAQAEADADNYIASYNIHTGNLRTEDGKQLWDEDLCLLSHWNLRDELKACYAGQQTDKQEMIYKVMERIVRQEIPASFVNCDEYIWCPYTNTLTKDGKEIKAEREQDIRYAMILGNFHAMLEMDKYCPELGNAIDRSFENSFEISAEEIRSLFTQLISSEEVKSVANIIRDRLGRELRPYDIWYDGFKSRSQYPEDELTAKTRKLYPNPEAYQKDIANMLERLGFDKEQAQFTNDHIVVEPARGSGHAWPGVGYDEAARLRTRISELGMDYKGYNIAVHEMGHNVEEVTSLYIDHYMLAGIPNTGFTEASAFLFQQRDLQLLGYGKHQMDDFATLDAFWGIYEIMGVSLVDMQMWEWLYAHPKATPSELKTAVLDIAANVWNEYYYPILGEKDCILLGIYSHMVNSPMYLPNYPIGHLVHFQLENKLAQCETDADFANEYLRVYRQGRLTPKWWMQGAVGCDLSIEPILERVREVIGKN